MGRTVLLLLIKEICVLAVSVVPENSKEATHLVRGVPRMRDLRCLFSREVPWKNLSVHLPGCLTGLPCFQI
ncbi:hypothetical protein AV530_001803 [Patagioenas fasciata monilis]|uniref:Secreted protein n=1 Tax=Patagioenas fasciata monilis TaxID=372326 RepID=A0A1V4KMJ4_PATFA|nr:hypothetical protein AV530_001803 [Patagioenas fasciata monilis]